MFSTRHPAAPDSVTSSRTPLRARRRTGLSGRIAVLMAALLLAAIAGAPAGAAGGGDEQTLIRSAAGVLAAAPNRPQGNPVTTSALVETGAAVPAFEDEVVDLALQVVPLAVGPQVRWTAGSTPPDVALPAASRSPVWARPAGPAAGKSPNRTIVMTLVIGLFVLTTSGIVLMWRHVGAQNRSRRPGWERWSR